MSQILRKISVSEPDQLKQRYDHTLVFVFQNERYQLVNIPDGSNREDVVHALELLARNIATDEDLT